MDLGQYLTEQAVLGDRELIALVGGGGKTTLMRALHDHAVSSGRSVVAGTTTMVYAAQAAGLPGFLASSLVAPETTSDPLVRAPAPSKLIGVRPEEVDAEFASGRFDLVVVEADGSRGKVVKAPAEHEPPIPSLSTLVLDVVGADCINRVIEDVAHRPMLVAAVCGCGPYERLTPTRLARLVTSERGGHKNVPAGARFALVLTRTGPRQADAAAELSSLLTASGVQVIVLPRLPDAEGYERETGTVPGAD